MPVIDILNNLFSKILYLNNFINYWVRFILPKLKSVITLTMVYGRNIVIIFICFLLFFQGKQFLKNECQSVRQP